MIAVGPEGGPHSGRHDLARTSDYVDCATCSRSRTESSGLSRAYAGPRAPAATDHAGATTPPTPGKPEPQPGDPGKPEPQPGDLGPKALILADDDCGIRKQTCAGR